MDSSTHSYLTRVGIPPVYHSRSIDEFPMVSAFVDRGDFAQIISGEKGLLIVGLEAARNAGILVGRWCALSNHTVCVASLSKYMMLMSKDEVSQDTDSDNARECHVLVVTDVQGDHSCPLHPYRQAAFEEHIRERRGNRLPTVLVVSNPNLAFWWESPFADMVNREFEKIEMGGTRRIKNG